MRMLEDVEVHHEAHVVTGELGGGQAARAHLLTLGHGQHGLGLQPRAVEHVVQRVLLLPRVPDLPGGPVPSLR